MRLISLFGLIPVIFFTTLLAEEAEGEPQEENLPLAYDEPAIEEASSAPEEVAPVAEAVIEEESPALAADEASVEQEDIASDEEVSAEQEEALAQEEEIASESEEEIAATDGPDVDAILAPKVEQLLFSRPHRDIMALPQCLICVQGLQIPDREEFRQKVRGYLNQPLTLRLIEDLEAAVLEYYQDHGYFMADVNWARENPAVGIVHIEVAEGRLGKTSSIPPRWFDNDQIVNEIRIRPGDVFRENALKEDLAWVNRSSYHQTTLVFEPGETNEVADLLIVTKDRCPVRVYSGYENEAFLVGGDPRWIGGFEYGNLWNLDHKIHYELRTATHWPKWWGQFLTYEAPLPWRHVFDAMGGYTQAHVSGNRGWAWNATGNYHIPFWFRGARQQVTLGYVFRSSNNVFDWGQYAINKYQISEFLLSYEVAIDESFGETKLDLTAIVSPGDMMTYNKDTFFAAVRPMANSNYVYLKFTGDQLFYLPSGFSWWMNLVGQLSSGRLLPSEQFSLGGWATIRGYEENEVIGDNGILFKNEWRTPDWRMPYSKRQDHGLQFLFFCDLGWVNQINPAILAKSHDWLGSAGPGVRYHFNDHLVCRFDYGFQLHQINRLIAEQGFRSRAHVAVTLGY